MDKLAIAFLGLLMLAALASGAPDDCQRRRAVYGPLASCEQQASIVTAQK
jgi:hypothetical protein